MLKILQRPVIFVRLEEHRDFNGVTVDSSLYFPATDEYMPFSDFLELTSLPRRYKNVNTELMKGLIATLRTCGLEYEDADINCCNRRKAKVFFVRGMGGCNV